MKKAAWLTTVGILLAGIGVLAIRAAGPATATDRPTLDLSKYRPPATACRASDLELVPRWGAALGSYGGTWRIINRGAAACRLSARPQAYLLNAAGRIVLHAQRPKTDFARDVTLDPGETASAIVLWSNWCRDHQGPFRLRIVLSRGALTTDVPGTATCTGPRSAGSTLHIEPFQGPSG